MRRVLWICATLLLAFPVFADPMAYKFTTTGSFGSSVQYLTFANQATAVSGTTSGGQALGLSLGSFTLSQPPPSGNPNYDGDTFTLDVIFALPPGIENGNTQTQTFDATLTGKMVHGQGSGNGVTITFDNPTQNFTFDDGTINGSFTFSIENGGILSGIDWSGDGTPAPSSKTMSSATYALLADIRDATQSNDTPSSVPEPASIIGLGSVLVGISVTFGRRKRA